MASRRWKTLRRSRRPRGGAGCRRGCGGGRALLTAPRFQLSLDRCRLSLKALLVQPLALPTRLLLTLQLGVAQLLLGVAQLLLIEFMLLLIQFILLLPLQLSLRSNLLLLLQHGLMKLEVRGRDLILLLLPRPHLCSRLLQRAVRD